MLPCFEVKVKGQGQGHGSRSTFCSAAVDIRDSALLSAAKRNRCHYQSKVFVCVSVISGHMLIIARMRSIGFYLSFVFDAHRLLLNSLDSMLLPEKGFSQSDRKIIFLCIDLYFLDIYYIFY